MKKYIWSVVTFLLIFTSFCQTQSDRNMKDELLNADKEFAEASVKYGAAEAFKMFLAENAFQLPHEQNPIYGADNIYKDMLGAGFEYKLTWEPQDGMTAASGDMGYTWGKYILHFGENFSEKSYGKYLNVWIKDKNGKWKVLVDMGNKSPEPK
ncbi:MAG: hypothetical protein KJ799_06550 [Bacteroidetes bacterium]|nr:hypothetical protein [Bacteroidota bacterium]